MDGFKCRKEISANEEAVEVLPTIGIERPKPGVVIYDRDAVHTRERREVFERFLPKLSVRLLDLWPDRQGR